MADTNKLRKLHWDNIFKTKDYTQVLWHQNSPIKSLTLIKTYAKKNYKIIDVGCGASLLVDNLLKCGYKNITLLDTAESSLEIVKKRIPQDEDSINFICSDIVNFTTSQKFNIWHDRAVFHFLLQKHERQQYFKILQESLLIGGFAIINTFFRGGQTECAGLKIIQYDYEKMINELPSGLELIEYENYTHITPKNGEQEYIYFLIKKI